MSRWLTGIGHHPSRLDYVRHADYDRLILTKIGPRAYGSILELWQQRILWYVCWLSYGLDSPRCTLSMALSVASVLASQPMPHPMPHPTCIRFLKFKSVWFLHKIPMYYNAFWAVLHCQNTVIMPVCTRGLGATSNVHQICLYVDHRHKKVQQSCLFLLRKTFFQLAHNNYMITQMN